MPAPKWTTPEQLQFLLAEDEKWLNVKAGNSSLRGFYVRTAQKFLEKWPMDPDTETLTLTKGDIEEAKKSVEAQLVKVSLIPLQLYDPLTFFWQRIGNWFSNHHRSLKSTPSVSGSVLDLSGKHSRKMPPLQKWQAFSIIYYRPPDSPLRIEARSLFEKRGHPAAIKHLAKTLPADADINTIDYLVFLSAYLRERCTCLSKEEEKKVQDHIDKQESLAVELQDRPWSLDDDNENDPLLAENRYIQA